MAPETCFAPGLALRPTSPATSPPETARKLLSLARAGVAHLVGADARSGFRGAACPGVPKSFVGGDEHSFFGLRKGP